MAKGGKKGPPYTDEPEYKYIVITKPCGIVSSTNRKQEDIDRVASWVCLMFNDASAVEAVWTMNTRDEIIVQLGLHIDIEPMLGAHMWRKIFSNNKHDPKAMSCVFQYNYRMCGEPGMHMWRENFASDGLPKDGIFNKPYPRPSYAKPRLGNIALPLPASRQRTPTPEPVSEPAPADKSTEEPTASAAEVKSEATERSAKLLSKMDPYEQDEASQQLLRPDNCAVKGEGTEYVPSRDMVDLFNVLNQSRAPTMIKEEKSSTPSISAYDRSNTSVKFEPDASDATAPSPDWMALHARYQAQQAEQPPISSSDVCSNSRDMHVTSMKTPLACSVDKALDVKPEPVDSPEAKPAPRSHEPTRDPRRTVQSASSAVKPEPVDATLPMLPPKPMPPSQDQRKSDRPADLSRLSFKRTKREDPEDHATVDALKRVKTESN